MANSVSVSGLNLLFREEEISVRDFKQGVDDVINSLVASVATVEGSDRVRLTNSLQFALKLRGADVAENDRNDG